MNSTWRAPPTGRFRLAVKAVRRRPGGVAMDLGYGYSYFLSFEKQLASRMEDHSTIGNLCCHLIGSPLLNASIFALLQHFVPLPVLVVCTSFLCLYCIAQDLMFGVPYMLLCGVGTYIQVLHTGSASVAVIGMLAAAAIQLGLGHAYFERRLPNETEGVRKGSGSLFAVVDMINEVYVSTFHFYSVLLIRLGFRPRLYLSVRAALAEEKDKIDSAKALRKKRTS